MNDGGQLLSESQLLFCFGNKSSKWKSTAKETNGKVNVIDRTYIPNRKKTQNE